jgi:hypothetical protein
MRKPGPPVREAVIVVFLLLKALIGERDRALRR